MNSTAKTGAILVTKEEFKAVMLRLFSGEYIRFDDPDTIALKAVLDVHVADLKKFVGLTEEKNENTQ